VFYVCISKFYRFLSVRIALGSWFDTRSKRCTRRRPFADDILSDCVLKRAGAAGRYARHDLRRRAHRVPRRPLRAAAAGRHRRTHREFRAWGRRAALSKTAMWRRRAPGPGC